MKAIQFMKNYFGTIIIIIGLIIVYEIATDLNKWIDPLLFPGFSVLFPALFKSMPELLQGLISSLGLLIPAYFLAVILGIVIGIFVGWVKPLRKNLVPIFRGISPIPATLYIPYVIAIFPTFWISSAFIIFICSFWPVLMGSINGTVLIESKYLDNARVMGIKGWKLFAKVIFPAALPMIFNGAEISLIFAFTLLAVAEMFGAQSGIGFFIQHYADFADYSKVLSGLLFMSIIIIIIMTIFDLIKKRFLKWTEQ